ncbi:MAG: DUF1080 domain-containing protein [FCB group bacterium]|jgi:hypothetical protein|nr:DUF1080 domain-containing protein [FCB group bacterium]
MRACAVVFLLLVALAWTANAQDPAPSGTPPVTPKEVTPLFNGKDLSGWKLYLGDKGPDPATVWSVKDGILHCTGKPSGYIRTEGAYRNYVLIVEWRWPAGEGNNGVLVHTSGPDEVWPKSIECQLHTGDAGDFWVIGGTDFAEHTDKSERRVPNKTDDTEKPLGEWNQMKIVANEDTLTVFVNDKEVNKATQTTVTGGAICLQSEGTPIEFRRVELQPLEEKKQ